eukprot:3810088-Rhodomonas_salina.1
MCLRGQEEGRRWAQEREKRRRRRSNTGVSRPIRACYALPGTGLAYVARRLPGTAGGGDHGLVLKERMGLYHSLVLTLRTSGTIEVRTECMVLP